MVGTKLEALKIEISHYLGIPYFSNIGKYKNHGENSVIGKGTAKEIALKTIEFANDENIEINSFDTSKIYNYQKKHHLGIDCSGLVSNLLIFYGNLLDKNITLNPRQTSADNLTSSPLSHPIKDLTKLQTADLVRQKDGKHILFIIEIIGDIIYYVESSREGRGVTYGHFKLNDDKFIHNGIYRLFLFD